MKQGTATRTMESYYLGVLDELISRACFHSVHESFNGKAHITQEVL